MKALPLPSTSPTNNRRPFSFWNEDCVTGAKARLPDGCIDLFITDPPYGIEGDTLDKHYNRKEGNVVSGYVDVPMGRYNQFSHDWISEAVRVTRANGTLYIVSGWTHLGCVLNVIERLNAKAGGKGVVSLVNHIIWQYNFGVFTSRKFVSSHYHILMLRKTKQRGQKGDYVFNYGSDDRLAILPVNQTLQVPKTKLLYADMQDVWRIKRQYRPGEPKNRNQLPDALVDKMLAYSSNPGDLVCDFFLGGFTTAKRCRAMGRHCCGFEVNPHAFNVFSNQFCESGALKMAQEAPMGTSRR